MGRCRVTERMLSGKISNEVDWESLWALAGPRRDVERLMGDDHRADQRWEHFAWCDACDRASIFHCDWLHAVEGQPNYRERLLCDGCELNVRERLLVRMVREYFDELPRTHAPTLFAYEDDTPLLRALSQRLTTVTICGSQHAESGVEVDDRAQPVDALALSSPDESFDVLVSNEILDHVPEPEAALRESYRVLRPGGILVATLPFHFTRTSTRRAEVHDGQVRTLLPELHRGHPASRYGTLVFHDLGWDLFDMLRKAGFSEPHFRCAHSLQYAYLGPELSLVLCATRGA